ncbi:differentially expressed in FDCP 6-like isoform X2 [Chiloscyllium plagiosum]|uniref:differentially expressed in FDCP 6-like isoform X2 n=1 Tax=Chiloscyllium plagiosum TaxID=36176 RepID=UPI001CB7C771|nr:differentially expressed in FDCP 6-like isoform X2 [Chiloscyllium plagiosum]
MDLKDELLKSIWYAFTALDLEQSGKVSKSQLKVLSYNLYTVLNIPHDPKILEDHFRDDNDGPVSSHGYMPYLNKYILDKVQEGHFVKENFHELCWTLTAKKNYTPSGSQGLISETSAFKLWCLFNFLSEDKYPLVMVCEEGYMWKKGNVRRNWNERWFVLKPSKLDYYLNEDLKEKKGEIHLDMDSSVEMLPDKEGKRCLFCVKTVNRTYELSASDMKRRQEWMDSIMAAIWILAENKSSMHKVHKERRREQRRQAAARLLEKKAQEDALAELQAEREAQLAQLEQLRQAQEEAEHLWRTKELHWMTQHEELQQKLQMELQKARTDKLQMQLVMEQKEQEAGAQRHRIRELETMQRGLERALRAEIEAHTNEQTVRSAQARLLQEEEEKLKELMMLRREQQDISRQEERQQQQQLTNKAQALQQAMEQLRESRQRNKQDLAMAEQTRRRASQHVKHWSVQLNRLMQPIVPGAAQNQPKSDIQSHRGGGAFIPKEIAVRRTEQHKMVPNPDCEERPGSDSEDYENMAEYIKNVSLTEANVIP